MFPIIFRIGGLPVYGYGLMIAIAFFIGIVGLTKEGAKAGLNEDKLFNMTIFIMVASLVGSRVLYILIELDTYLQAPITMLHVRSGGLSFHGGLIAGAGVGLYYTWRNQMPQGKVADLVAPWLALGYAIVRIGCLLNGCCFGRPTGVAWALPAAYIDTTPRHPTQLYAFILALIIFVALRWRKKYVRFHGQLFWEFILYYSIYRFIVEGFREASAYMGFLTLGQAVSLVGAVAAFVVIRIWPMGRRLRT